MPCIHTSSVKIRQDGISQWGITLRGTWGRVPVVQIFCKTALIKRESAFRREVFWQRWCPTKRTSLVYGHMQRIADSQLAQDQAAQQQVSTPGPVPSQQPVAFTPAAQSIGQALLSATPAANLTCSTAKATSPGSARYGSPLEITSYIWGSFMWGCNAGGYCIQHSQITWLTHLGRRETGGGRRGGVHIFRLTLFERKSFPFWISKVQHARRKQVALQKL